MFLGQHLHTLDGKNRLILPARYRDELASGFIASQMDGCLAVWPATKFEAKASRMGEQLDGEPEERDAARLFFASAEGATPDSQGRIALPAHLREFANLEKEVVVTGAFDHIEIWNADTWQERQQAGEQALGRTTPVVSAVPSGPASRAGAVPVTTTAHERD
jgi:MraZ protein